jgi:hypothetical protein
MRATERGLKNYYVSIMKPMLEALFSVKLQYKTQDFTLIAASVEVLKTFTLIDDTLVSADNKRRIINGLLGLPEDAKGDPAPKPEPEGPSRAGCASSPARDRRSLGLLRLNDFLRCHCSCEELTRARRREN